MDMDIDYVNQFSDFNHQNHFDFSFEPLLAHHQPTNPTLSSNTQMQKMVKLSKSSSVSTFDHKENNMVDIKEETMNVKPRRRKSSGSHSAAERARRERINHKFRCLQELVPGCYNKAMGMAVMLDEIINYVQSLQNQVEFLSMELAAASSWHDPNMEKEGIRYEQAINSFAIAR